MKAKNTAIQICFAGTLGASIAPQIAHAASEPVPASQTVGAAQIREQMDEAWRSRDAELARQVLDRVEEHLEPDAPELLYALTLLVRLIQLQHGVENEVLFEAVSAQERIVEFHIRRDGPAHRDTFNAQILLASLFSQYGGNQSKKALDILEDVAANVRRAVSGQNTFYRHSHLGTVLDRYADELEKYNNFDESVVVRTERLELARKFFGPSHHETIRYVKPLGFALERSQGSIKAKEFFAASSSLLEPFDEAEKRPFLVHHIEFLERVGDKLNLVEHYADLIALNEQLGWTDGPDHLDILSRSTANLIALGRYRDAVREGRDNWNRHIKLLGTEDARSRRALAILVSALHKSGDYTQAKTLLEDQIPALLEGSASPRSWDELRLASVYAELQILSGQRGTAEPLLKRLAEFGVTQVDQFSPEAIGIVTKYLAVIRSSGRLFEVRKERARLLPYDLQDALRRGAGFEIVKSLADLNLATGDIHKANELYNYYLTQVFSDRDAELAFIDTEVILRTALIDEYIYGSLVESRTLTDLPSDQVYERVLRYGRYLVAASRLPEAEGILAAAKRQATLDLGPQHPLSLELALRLTETRHQRSPDGNNLYEIEQAVAAYGITFGHDHPTTFTAQAALARAMVRQGLPVDAIKVLSEILPQQLAMRGEFNVEPKTSQMILGRARCMSGDFETGIALLQEAREFFRRRWATQRQNLDPESSIIDDWLANCLSEAGRFSEALPLAQQTLEYHRKEADRISFFSETRVVSPREERRIRNAHAQTRKSAELVLDGLWELHGAEATSDAVLGSAFLLMQTVTTDSTSGALGKAVARQLAYRGGHSALVDKRETSARDWERLEETRATIVADAGFSNDALRMEILTSQEQYRVDKELQFTNFQIEQEVPGYAAFLRQPEIGLEEARNSLREEEAILLVVATARGLHSLYLSEGQVIWVRSDFTKDKVDENVAILRDSLEVQSNSQYLPTYAFSEANQLYQAIFSSVEARVTLASTINVVSTGALESIPFGVLVREPISETANPDSRSTLQNAKWLANDVSLVQQPSVASIAWIRGEQRDITPRDSQKFIGFGAPRLSPETTVRGAQQSRPIPVSQISQLSSVSLIGGVTTMDQNYLLGLSSLPGAEEEVLTVSREIDAPETDLFLGPEMRESIFRGLDWSDAKIVHIATHGLKSSESSEIGEPGLVFTPPPLPSIEDDGYLSAPEIAELRFEGKPLVVLSACNTAASASDDFGSGYSGLTRAFLFAGAGSALVSHWPVFDDVSAQLTIEVFRASNSGAPRAEALRLAMQRVRMSDEIDAYHPAAWAPFSLVGEWR